ncbi:hypothetical protein M406DRAFT_357276 [Cryphonectria parasitica EP155]|uniref:Tat pathway signal sequence n=1 Tax=Cryphonectria parasitica (strain ATCC 38755 / EP155) TaxID=660469 RepID=A0A9P5CNG2_CRYP1|nr:uncharacterized protein M406DRAFT_357276 [Cryphonectria parasitica EP155]KAF3763880.1 hypothetical protein M406DRAFT_357276 [Cryphonectria parasitica EP155]
MALPKFSQIANGLLSPKEKMTSPSYMPVSDDGGKEQSSQDASRDGSSEQESFLHDEEWKPPVKRSLLRRYWRLGLEVILLGVSCVLFTLTVYHKPSLHQRQLECGRLLGQWLPDAEQGVEYEVQRFKGTFGWENEYTGIGPETDAAWDKITDGPAGGAIGITKEQWEAVNQFHDYPVLLEKDHGTGQYLASLDVFHQLHCVDLLRKATHREYYDKHEGSFAGAPESIVQGHLSHCVEMLRQTLMCHGDISLLTYNWVEGRSMPHPNFNTIHTCKKWDTLTKWNEGRDITVEWEDGVGKKMLSPPLKPAGVKGMKTPP